ncbi:hypothetical protein Tco_0294725 [Tanacetum coccineum]
MFKRRLITTDQASVFIGMMSDHNSSDLAPQRQEMSVENVSSGLVPQGQKASDYDNSDPVPPRQNVVPSAEKTVSSHRSELGIQDHSNEPSSSKLVPKVVPLAVKTATSRQELELLFHHHIAMPRTTGINPMIQPEPEDLPKDNPKLEIEVLRELPAEVNKAREDEIIYSHLDDARYDRALLRARVNRLDSDRPFHRRTALLIEEEARLSRAAWARSMDACDQVHSEGISLRTTVVAQQSEITELQAADHRRQAVITDLLKADYRRQRQLVETLKIVKSLKAQMIEMQ